MFNWHNPYLTTRTPVFARNIVSTSQPLAAQAGLHVLRNGGNAVDAAIAAAAVITMTEPCSNGLGSDNFAILWDPATQQLHGLNSSGTAPAAWTPEYFGRQYGDDPGKRPMRGWDAVTVPGAVAGWSLLHRRFGKLPFRTTSRLPCSSVRSAWLAMKASTSVSIADCSIRLAPSRTSWSRGLLWSNEPWNGSNSESTGSSTGTSSRSDLSLRMAYSLCPRWAAEVVMYISRMRHLSQSGKNTTFDNNSRGLVPSC